MARRKPDPTLASRNIAIVPLPRLIRGLALLHHPSLQIVGFVHSDTGGNDKITVDFIAVDEATRSGASSKILTEVAAKSVWDPGEDRPNLSDHLPVEGIVDIWSLTSERGRRWR